MAKKTGNKPVAPVEVFPLNFMSGVDYGDSAPSISYNTTTIPTSITPRALLVIDYIHKDNQTMFRSAYTPLTELFGGEAGILPLIGFEHTSEPSSKPTNKMAAQRSRKLIAKSANKPIAKPTNKTAIHLSRKPTAAHTSNNATVDPGIYVYNSIITLLYTDDPLLTGPSVAEIDLVIQKMKDNKMKLTFEPCVSDSLGISTQGSLNMTQPTQPHLTQSILKDLRLDSSITAKIKPIPGSPSDAAFYLDDSGILCCTEVLAAGCSRGTCAQRNVTPITSSAWQTFPPKSGHETTTAAAIGRPAAGREQGFDENKEHNLQHCWDRTSTTTATHNSNAIITIRLYEQHKVEAALAGAWNQ